MSTTTTHAAARPTSGDELYTIGLALQAEYARGLAAGRAEASAAIATLAIREEANWQAAYTEHRSRWMPMSWYLDALEDARAAAAGKVTR